MTTRKPKAKTQVCRNCQFWTQPDADRDGKVRIRADRSEICKAPMPAFPDGVPKSILASHGNYLLDRWMKGEALDRFRVRMYPDDGQFCTAFKART